MSKMDSFFKLSPLNTTVSRKVICDDQSSLESNLVLWYFGPEFDGRVEFVSLFNKLIHVFFITVTEGEDIVNISSPLFWLGLALLFQSCFNFSHENILANDTAILVPLDVPLFWTWFSTLNWNEFSFRMRPSISLAKEACWDRWVISYETNRMPCIRSNCGRLETSSLAYRDCNFCAGRTTKQLRT